MNYYAYRIKRIIKKQNINKNDFIEAQVTDIIDGDTIKVSYNDREYELKMIGVNSPETNDPTEKEIIDKMFNAKLVKEGYAQTYTYQPDSKYCIV